MKEEGGKGECEGEGVEDKEEEGADEEEGQEGEDNDKDILVVRIFHGKSFSIGRALIYDRIGW